MKKFIFIIYLFGIYSNCFSQNYWQQTNGPKTASVNFVYYHDAKIYCGTDGAGILTSVDSGLTWLTMINAPKTVTSIGVAANGYIFAASNLPGAGNYSLYRSTDGGSNWTFANNVYSFVRTILCTLHDTIYLSSSGSGVYKSIDYGNTWQTSSTGIDNNGLSCLYRTNGILIGGGYYSGRIYRSTDNAATWTQVYYSGQNDNVNCITSDLNGNIFVSINSKGIYVSSNSGLNWNSTNLGTTNILDLDVDFHGKIYATAYDRYFFTSNGGLMWKQTTNCSFAQSSFQKMCVDSGNVYFAYNSIGGSVYRKNQSGQVCDLLSGSFINSKIVALINCPSGGFLLASNKFNGMYKSSDFGSNWSAVSQAYGGTYTCLCLDSSQNIFAGTDGCIYKSTNFGSSWSSNYNINSQINAIAASANGTLFAASTNGLYRSSNYGSNWIRVFQANGNYFTNIAISNSNKIYISSFTPPAVFLSTDNGDNWSDISLNNQFYLLNSISISTNNTLFAGAVDGIYRSTNEGILWTHVTQGEEILNVLPVGSGQIYAISKKNGILYSNLDGNYNSWQHINGGLYNLNANCLTIDANGYLFCGTDGMGVFKSTFITGKETLLQHTPNSFSLSQNYPNPFNPSTTIKFDIPNVGTVPRTVRLMIYDILGKEIVSLINKQLQPGSYSVNWDASNYPSGVYFYKLESEGFTESKKMVLIK